jgi:hypothetical protein
MSLKGTEAGQTPVKVPLGRERPGKLRDLRHIKKKVLAFQRLPVDARGRL